MGYPIGLILSVGESMIVIVAMAIWWCSPVSETPDWWTWSLLGLQKFKVVQVWRCLRATCWTSQSFLGTAPFEANLNPNSAGIQLWFFPKHIPGAVYVQDFDRFWSSSHMPFPHFTTISNHQNRVLGCSRSGYLWVQSFVVCRNCPQGLNLFGDILSFSDSPSISMS